MPNNTHIIKDGQIVANEWQLITELADSLTEGKLILSVDNWLKHKDALSSRTHAIGLWLKNDEGIKLTSKELGQFSVIAVDFPTFMDGRGFSIGRLLRERLNYQGELRATGGVIRDQLCSLRRCGFNAFELNGEVNLEAAIASLTDFSDGYQSSVDQPTPLFRRRA